MTEILINIPESIYSRELKKIIFRLYAENSSSLIHFLFNLLDTELSDTSLKSLKIKDDTSTLEQHFKGFKNKEITARWNDYKFLTNPQNKVKNIREAVDTYIEVYNQTQEIQYLSRAFHLIKKTKSIFKNQIDTFSDYAIQEIKKLQISYYKLTVLKQSYFLNPSSFETELVEYFKNLMEKSLINKDFSEARNYID